MKKSLVFILLLMQLSSCSKKAGDSSTSSTPVTPPSTLSNQVSTPSICTSFYNTLDASISAYIDGSKFDELKQLQESFQALQNFLNKEYSIETVSVEKIKKNDCSLIEQYATKIKSSKIPDVYKGINPFNEKEFVYENLLDFFLTSLDRFSGFSGPYSLPLSDNLNPTLSWGLRLLYRSDYIALYQPEKDRTPQYLYVETSAKYLKDILPPQTKILEINDYVINSGSFEKALEKISSSETATLKIQKLNPTTQIYNAPESVSVKFQNVYKNHEDVPEVSLQTFQQKLGLPDGTSRMANIGYMQIPTFDLSKKEFLVYEILSSFEDLPKLDGTIIDLRSNGGGYVPSAAEFLRTILPGQAIFDYITDSKHKVIPNHLDSSISIKKYGKIIVLIDYATASAAELVTAALRDYRAALIIGQNSFEKGIGQITQSLPQFQNGEASLTTFYAYSPLGKSWYLSDGITPDILVDEPSNNGIEIRLQDLKDRGESLPEMPESEIAHDEFDPHTDEIPNQVTDDIISHLQEFKDNSPQPDECIKMGKDLNEEDSCTLAWGKKLIGEWIRSSPNS